MVPYYGLLISILIFVQLATGLNERKLEVVHEWRQVDFTYPNAQTREAALRSRKFIPENCVIIDVDVWKQTEPIESRIYFSSGHTPSNNKPSITHKPKSEMRIFVTLPRFKTGIPVTLAEVTDHKKGDTTLLDPFPNWGAHRDGNCEGLISVYRMKVDSCGRLWVIDSGRVENFTPNPKTLCGPQIAVYDLQNGDKLIARYRIPRSQMDDDSLFVTLAVDERGGECGKDTFVYIADVTAFKLIVYDFKNNYSWRVSSNYFYPFPVHGRFDIAGTHFNLMDGILALALGPLNHDDRMLYFHSLASVREGSVPTSVLRNRTLFQSDSDAGWQSFSLSEPARPSQSAMEAMTDNGILIFSSLSEIALACWNSHTAYTPENIHMIYQDNETLQFPSGMKIIGDSIWISTNQLQNYIVDRTHPEHVKYRVLRGSVDHLLKGTPCDLRSAGYLVHEPGNPKFNLDSAEHLTHHDAHPPPPHDHLFHHHHHHSSRPSPPHSDIPSQKPPYLANSNQYPAVNRFLEKNDAMNKEVKIEQSQSKAEETKPLPKRSIHPWAVDFFKNIFIS